MSLMRQGGGALLSDRLGQAAAEAIRRSASQDRLVISTPPAPGAKASLPREHAQIRDLIDELLGRAHAADSKEDLERARRLGTALLGVLARHRQRGADLVYEAYELDIGARPGALSRQGLSRRFTCVREA